ncbi:MAG: hypothetical protein K6A65_07870 [Succinivibrionaceae bacterium]|nr:hypothetical protein [Succinivibrionaceae bacterium]
MTFDKTMIFGFAAGLVLGCVGYRIYNENRDRIGSVLGKCGAAEGAAEAGDLTLEELESQKERLEDLIAEVKARKEGE